MLNQIHNETQVIDLDIHENHNNTINQTSRNLNQHENAQLVATNPHDANIPHGGDHPNNRHSEFTVEQQKIIYWDIIHGMFMLHLTLIMIVAMINYEIPPYFIFVVLFANDIYHLILLSRLHMKFRESRAMIKRNCMCLFERIFNLFAKILLVYALATQELNALYCLLPIVIQTIVRICIYNLDKRQTDCTSIFDFMIIILRIFALVQGISILMMIDDNVTWKWKEVFWTYWVIFSVMIGVNFGTLLLLISKICQKIWGELDSYECVVFIFINSMSITLGSCFVILGIINKFDNQNERTLNTTFYVLLGNFLMHVIMLKLFYKDIITFLLSVALQQEDDEDQNTDPHDRRKQKQVKKTFKSQALSMPQFLTKLSSSYFKRVTSNILSPIKSAKKQQIQQKIALQNEQLESQKDLVSSKLNNSMYDFKEGLDLENNQHEEHAGLHLGPFTRAILQQGANKFNKDVEIIEFHQKQNKPLEPDQFKMPSYKYNVERQHQYDTPPRLQKELLHQDHQGFGDVILEDVGLSQQDQQQLNALADHTRIDKQRLNYTRAQKRQITKQFSPNQNITNQITSPQTCSPKRIHQRNQSMQVLNSPFAKKYLNQAFNSPNKKDYNQAFLNFNNANANNQPLSMNNSGSGNEQQLFQTQSPEQKQAQQQSQQQNQQKGPLSLNQSNMNCLICFENEPDSVFMECGHGGICYQCSLDLWKATGECYLCRNKIEKVLQLDLANSNSDYIQVKAQTEMIIENEPTPLKKP